MDTLELLVLAGSCFLAGLFTGAFFMYRGFPPKSRQQIEVQLEDSEKQLLQYKAQVSEYFSHTSALVDNLNISYRDLQNHIVTSAEQISSLEISSPTLRLNQETLNETPTKTATLRQPLDYAPKKGNLGTLNEGYGLKEDQQRTPPLG